MRVVNVWLLSFQVAICLAAAKLTEINGGRDPAACQIIDCSVSMAPRFCPIKCSHDREICRIVDCSSHQSETFCPRKCSVGDKDVVTYGPPASIQSTDLDEILISSTGPAAEYRGDILGWFEATGQTYGGKKVWRQKDDNDGGSYLWWDTHSWAVGNELGGLADFRNLANSQDPPVNNWQYYDGESFVDNDSTLTVTHVPAIYSPAKTTLDITASAEVARVVPEALGRFQYNGRWSKGRPIYQKTGSTTVLWVEPGYVNWQVKSEASDVGQWFIGSGKGTVTPDDPTAGSTKRFNLQFWDYKDGNTWKEDSSIKIRFI